MRLDSKRSEAADAEQEQIESRPFKPSIEPAECGSIKPHREFYRVSARSGDRSSHNGVHYQIKKNKEKRSYAEILREKKQIQEKSKERFPFQQKLRSNDSHNSTCNSPACKIKRLSKARQALAIQQQ